jgi:hypothetical protein
VEINGAILGMRMLYRKKERIEENPVQLLSTLNFGETETLSLGREVRKLKNE